MAYAYICSACKHPLGRHLMTSGGELVAGPYQCGQCACQIRQDAPCYSVDKREFEAHYEEPEDVSLHPLTPEAALRGLLATPPLGSAEREP